MTIQLKNFKEAGGEETIRFQASLYLNGKKIAVVSNDGNGGGHRYNFDTHELKDQFDRIVTELQTTDFQPKENRLHHHLQEYLESMRETFPDYGQDEIDRDMVIDCLITQTMQLKQFKKWCKGATVFRLPNAPKGEYKTIREAYNEHIKQFLLTEYGEDVEILNELIAIAK